jgi:hypothetical protein
MWDRYTVSVRCDRLVGGIPANEKMMRAWLDAKGAKIKAPAVMPAELRDQRLPVTPAEAAADQIAMREALDPEETHAVVFYRAPGEVHHSFSIPEHNAWQAAGRPCYEGRCFKAALKEAANILGTTTKRQGLIPVSNFRSKLAERVFVMERLVPILVPVQVDERPISVMTAQGPRTSIKRYEYACDVELRFTIKVLEDGIVEQRHLEMILDYLQDNGIGADRSQGSGTFQLTEFRRD